MTVKELIKELEKMPKNYKIEVLKNDESVDGFEEFFIDKISKNEGNKKVNITIW